MVSQVSPNEKRFIAAEQGVKEASELSAPPDENELLIRSLSTLLHHIHPQVRRQVSREKDKENSQRDTLDRLATLFLRRGGTDVAALTADRGPKGNKLVAIHASDSVLSVVGNLAKRDERIQVSHQNKIILKELQTNLFSFGLRYGYDTPSLTPVVHAVHLCDLIMAVHRISKTLPNTRGDAVLRTKEVKRLSRYVYFYSLEKVATRLKLPASQGSLSFFDMFFETSENITIKPKLQPYNIPETIEIYTFEDISSLAFEGRPRGWIYKIWKHDERWLLPLIGEDASSEGATVVQDNGVHHIDLTRDRAWSLLKFFLDTLESLREATQHIINHHGTEDAAKYRDKSRKLRFKRALDDISKAMRRISELTYLTPSFWRVMYSVESTLRLHLIRAQRLSMRGSAQSDHDEKPIPAVEKATQRASTNTLKIHREAEMIGIATDSCFSARSGVIVDRVRHWLKCLSGWDKAVEDLAMGRAIHELLDLGLHIEVYEVKLPRNKDQQATLDSTLDAIQPQLKQNLNRDQQLKLLCEAAARNKGHSTPSQDILLGMTTPGGVNECLRKWPESFVGQFHCESILGLMLFEWKAMRARMGMTKLCCACCAAFLEALGFKKNARTQHGQVFPWTPPQGTPQDIKEKLVQCLAQHVADYLDMVADVKIEEIDRESREEQTPSGSEAGSESEPFSDHESDSSENVTDNHDGHVSLDDQDDLDDHEDSESEVEDNEVADEDLREVEEEIDAEDESPLPSTHSHPARPSCTSALH